MILLFGFGAYQLTLGRQFKPEGPMPGMMERPPYESNPIMNNPENVDFEGREMLLPKKMDKPRPPMGRPGMVPRPPILMDNISVIKLFIAVLMIGTNLGMKVFFRGKRDEEVVAKLEEQNLKYQLKYLKYQVNPHFFMNTLNNIHALVDINPEQAKSTIVELSKLMRYVLYEADKKFISLQREIDFIDHYIALMRIRYTEMVRITTNMPQEAGNVEIPPLIFIMFVENAFKHGVSYQKDSFIDISIQLENERILFRCKNSKHSSDLVEGEGGLGLVNAKKRLDLIYGDDYSLQIYNEPLTYEVSLDLPAYLNSRLV
ncbi:MAG: histidine kinase [Phocaeicola sp.]|nr:histidine kinase [Phocaeicola sp.]